MADITPTIEMTDYTLKPHGSGQGIKSFHFTLSKGHVCAIETQNPDDSNNLLRAIATLTRPVRGTYHYEGKKMELKSNEQMLSCKSKIGYVAPDAALISNMTVRQNLLLRRYYFENDLTIDIDEQVKSLCDHLGIFNKLDKRPSELNKIETLMAIVIREIEKKPRVLLLEGPEDFIGHAKFDFLVKLFNDWISQRKPVVFISYDRRLIRRFANRKITIADGILTTVDLKRTGEDQ